MNMAVSPLPKPTSSPALYFGGGNQSVLPAGGESRGFGGAPPSRFPADSATRLASAAQSIDGNPLSAGCCGNRMIVGSLIVGADRAWGFGSGSGITRSGLLL